MLLMIDNFDSFTYNLVQHLGKLGYHTLVYRNNAVSVTQIAELQPDGILISPGPGTPYDAGVSLEVIEYFCGKIPIFGVCLGHQCLGQHFGGRVIRADRIVHGKTSLIYHDGRTIYKNLPNPFPATRYHSLILERQTLPSCLEISAETEEGEIMGIRHRDFSVEGVQFHPESILCSEGEKLLKNFMVAYGIPSDFSAVTIVRDVVDQK